MNPHYKKQNNEDMITLDSQTIFTDNTIKYYGWTSISTLYDLISWLKTTAIPTIIQCEDNKFNTTLLTTLKKEKCNILFPLNRFNIGYNTSNPSSSPSNKRKNECMEIE